MEKHAYVHIYMYNMYVCMYVRMYVCMYGTRQKNLSELARRTKSMMLGTAIVEAWVY